MPRVDVRGGLRAVRVLLKRRETSAAEQAVSGLLDALDVAHPAAPRDERLVSFPFATEQALARVELVKGCPLVARIYAVDCVARQMLSERELKRGGKKRKARSRELARHDGKRGTSTTYPSCRSEHCAVGRGTREVLGEDSEAQAMAARATRCSDTSTT